MPSVARTSLCYLHANAREHAPPRDLRHSILSDRPPTDHEAVADSDRRFVFATAPVVTRVVPVPVPVPVPERARDPTRRASPPMIPGHWLA